MPVITRLLSLVERMARRLHPIETEKTEKLLEWTTKKYRLHKNSPQKNNKVIYRGEIYWCELGENVGNEESKRRPCVVIQNQKGNDNAPTTIVAPITNATINLPVAVPLVRTGNTNVTGTIDLGQLKIIAKSRLIGASIDKLTPSEQKKVDLAIMKSTGTFSVLLHEQKKYTQKDEYARQLSNLLKDIRNELGVNDNKDIIAKLISMKNK